MLLWSCSEATRAFKVFYLLIIQSERGEINGGRLAWHQVLSANTGATRSLSPFRTSFQFQEAAQSIDCLSNTLTLKYNLSKIFLTFVVLFFFSFWLFTATGGAKVLAGCLRRQQISGLAFAIKLPHECLCSSAEFHPADQRNKQGWDSETAPVHLRRVETGDRIYAAICPALRLLSYQHCFKAASNNLEGHSGGGQREQCVSG